MYNFNLVNADTDSIMVCKKDQSDITDFERGEFLKNLNAQFPDLIVFEDDGYFHNVVVVKTKNYVLKDAKSGKISIKGSALKATMKEPALKEFINDVIGSMLEGREDVISDLYMDYARLCCSVDMDSIAKWCSKKTVTKAVLSPKRTTEQRILDAIKAAKKPVQEGDKIHVFFETESSLGLLESFNGTISKKKLLGKLFTTAKIFETVLDMERFPNLTLKKNRGLLEEMTAPATGDLQPGGQN